MERLLADLRLTRASDFHLSLLKKTSRCPYARARRYRGAVASACLVPGVRRRVPCTLAPCAGRPAPPPPIGLISRRSVSGCGESTGPLAALYSSEFWMSGLVASFRSGDVLRPSRRSGGVLRPSCTVAERDGPPKGKSPVLPLPEQAASKVPKNTKATAPTKRCNMTRDAPRARFHGEPLARESNQPSKLAAASTTPVTNAAVLKNRKMSFRTFAIVASPSGFSGALLTHPSILTKT